MAKPDTRKRDRAAYMRDYRAQRAKVNPSLRAQIEELRARVARLEVDHFPGPSVEAITPEQDARRVSIQRAAFGTPRPAPKQKAKAR